MSAPHPFPWAETHLVRTTKHMPYQGWTIWGYQEWVRDSHHAPGRWVDQVLAVRGEEVLMPLVGVNIRRMIDEADLAQTQMSADLAGLVVTEGAPTGLMPL